MGTTEVFMLNGEQFRYYWPQIEECLDEAPKLWNETLTKVAIVERVLNGSIQMWALCPDGEDIESVFMTRIVQMRGERPKQTLQVFWMYGERALERLDVLSDLLDRFGTAASCEQLEVVAARKGWDRVLRPFGAEFTSATWTRAIRLRKGN